MDPGQRRRLQIEAKDQRIAELRSELGGTLRNLPQPLRLVSPDSLVTKFSPIFVPVYNNRTQLSATSLRGEPEPSRGEWLALKQQFRNLPAEPTAEEQLMAAAASRIEHEIQDADEPNLLEEDDMHVFGHEPLNDHLELVSCNVCQRSVRASQYAAHAERCRSLAAEEAMGEAMAGAQGVTAAGAAPQPPSRKPPRKNNRKGGSQPEGGAPHVQFTLEGEENGSEGAGFGEASAKRQARAKRSRATTPATLHFSRVRKAGEDEGAAAPAWEVTGHPHQTKRMKSSSPGSALTEDELDSTCGVPVQGGVCRRSLTCKVHSEAQKRSVPGRRQPYDALLAELKAHGSKLVLRRAHGPGPSELEDFHKAGSRSLTDDTAPAPLACKIYCFRHRHRMRALVASLFRDACEAHAKASPSSSPLPSSGGAGEEAGGVTQLQLPATAKPHNPGRSRPAKGTEKPKKGQAEDGFEPEKAVRTKGAAVGSKGSSRQQKVPRVEGPRRPGQQQEGNKNDHPAGEPGRPFLTAKGPPPGSVQNGSRTLQEAQQQALEVQQMARYWSNQAALKKESPSQHSSWHSSVSALDQAA